MQIASEDIICYKLIQIYHRSDGDDYRTYFQHTKIELNEPIIAERYLTIQGLNEREYLDGEVVHAFCDFYCDDSDIDWYIEDTRSCPYFEECNVSIAKVECIIPKGTMFCEGVDEDENPCYGALEIIPKRIVKTVYSYEILNSQTQRPASRTC